MAGTPGACSQVFCHPIRCILGATLARHGVSLIIRTTHTTQGSCRLLTFCAGGDQGDADSEGGNEPNVSQVPQSVGSSKRRCVVPVLDGVIPRGLPAVDVLAQGLSGYSHTDLNRLKEALEERLNDEATNSLFREAEEQDRLLVESLGSKGSQG